MKKKIISIALIGVILAGALVCVSCMDMLEEFFGDLFGDEFGNGGEDYAKPVDEKPYCEECPYCTYCQYCYTGQCNAYGCNCH